MRKNKKIRDLNTGDVTEERHIAGNNKIITDMEKMNNVFAISRNTRARGNPIQRLSKSLKLKSIYSLHTIALGEYRGQKYKWLKK